MMTKRICSIPDLFGFGDWYESKFMQHCAHHDRHYALKDVSKWYADFVYSRDLWRDGYVLLSVAAFVALTSFGWLHWYKIKGDDHD